MKDGKANVTTWTYNRLGRATNKVDAASNVVFGFTYDANDTLTNRWTPGRTNAINTIYKYSAAGNITNIAYPSVEPA